MERAQIMAAIRDAPNDDMLRMVAADWFEEQGGESNAARAEFIRIQVERARLPFDHESQAELQAHEYRLLKRFARVWCDSHFIFKKSRFRRGFIESVHLHLQHFQHHRRQMFALEPVLEVSLTGWYRAPTSLIRRVANCTELHNVRSLIIHHQGPHHDPRSNLIELLESPHLTQLKSLNCPRVDFDADARRRFEGLAILRTIRELAFPTLSTYPENPGQWFSDGGLDLASQWRELRSIVLPSYLRIDLLRQFMQMPAWSMLESLGLALSMESEEGLLELGSDLPKSLKRLELFPSIIPPIYSTPDSFFTELAKRPLESLRLDIRISPLSIRSLLDEKNRCRLQELHLTGGHISQAHAEAIAESEGTKNLHILDLCGNFDFDAEAARTLFHSPHLRNVVELNLRSTQIGTEGAVALTQARFCKVLRSLAIDIGTVGIEILISSRQLGNLTELELGFPSYPELVELTISAEMATAIARLSNLVMLHVHAYHFPKENRIILTNNESLAWVFVYGESEAEKEMAELLAIDWAATLPLDKVVEKELTTRR